MAGALAAPLCLGLLPSAAFAADVPTLDPAQASAGFLLRAQADTGLIGSPGQTADTVFGLVAEGIGGARLSSALDALETAAPDYGYDKAGNAIPGSLSKLVLALTAGGRDATEVGSKNLVADLQSTAEKTGPNAGRLNDVVDSYDDTGAFTQSLGLLALKAADAETTAVRAWLVGQQCDNGGFEYGARKVAADGSLEACEGPDTNTTGYAVQALAGTPTGDAALQALDFLDKAQTPSGGFPFSPPQAGTDGDADPTSTALGVQAILVAGESPYDDRWTTSTGGNPVSALVGSELGCSVPAADRGGFLGFSGKADVFATSAVLTALAGAALPVDAEPGTTGTDTPVVNCGALAPVDLTTAACPDFTVSPAGFTDVPRGSTFALAIDCLAEGNLVRGTTATTFNPTGKVNRAQTAVLLARSLTALGLTLDRAPAGFSDLTGQTDEARDAVNALSNLGVVRGTSATTFSPDATVSRGQEASFLARAVAKAPKKGAAPILLPGLDAFTDDNDSVHAANIDALARAGVSTGKSVGTYDEQAAVTRQESAAFLARALQVVLAANDQKGPVGA